MIPIATTTVTVVRPAVADATADGYDPPGVPVTVTTGLRAHISVERPQVNLVGGDRAVYTAAGTFDRSPALVRGDTVTDNRTGVAYRLLWASGEASPSGFGLYDYQTADLVRVEGDT